MTPDELRMAFAQAMARLGPFEPSPRVAAAVSGGADSMALALLASEWVCERGGSLLALVVDHGLRSASGPEASVTVARLGNAGITSRLLRLGLSPGPALAERARRSRYQALREACAEDGRLHLLLGHHAADQAETVLIRRAGGSGADGLAAMPMLVENDTVRLLRPLLNVPPVALRTFLKAAGWTWVEDPSNRDLRALRPQIRAGLGDPDGTGPEITQLCGEARIAGRLREAREHEVADELAACATFHPEGFARISSAKISPRGLAAVIQAVSGADYPPPGTRTAALAASLSSETLAGVRLIAAGRLGPGWLVVREAAAVGPPVAARGGAVWDGRFRLDCSQGLPAGTRIEALGPDSAEFRRKSWLPAAVLTTLPALRCGNLLAAVPHLAYRADDKCSQVRMSFIARRPAACAGFLPA